MYKRKNLQKIKNKKYPTKEKSNLRPKKHKKKYQKKKSNHLKFEKLKQKNCFKLLKLNITKTKEKIEIIIITKDGANKIAKYTKDKIFCSTQLV